MSYFSDNEDDDVSTSVDSDNDDDNDDDINYDELSVSSENENDDDDDDESNVNNLINSSEIIDDYNEDIDDFIDNNKFNKLESLNKTNYIQEFYPDLLTINHNEIINLCKIVRDDDNNIIDNLHKTIPFLTKYEKTTIIGQRAKQINNGATPFIKAPENIIDGAIIAFMELQQKQLPFIVKRPLPNGGCEYWHLADLELID
jgi:DNA-directed RNA polymerase I, II, and III subunit RPABC2